MSIDTKDSDLLDKAISEVAQADELLKLQQAILAMPSVDREKVQAVINKLENGTLEISALRIAQKIIDDSLNK